MEVDLWGRGAWSDRVDVDLRPTRTQDRFAFPWVNSSSLSTPLSRNRQAAATSSAGLLPEPETLWM